MQINAMIFFDAPFRGRHVIPLLGVDQTTSLLVVLIFVLIVSLFLTRSLFLFHREQFHFFISSFFYSFYQIREHICCRNSACCQCFFGAFRICYIDICKNVDFADAAGNGMTEVFICLTGTAMMHQRCIHLRRNGFDTCKIQFRRKFISPMGCAYCNGKSVTACMLNKF